MDGNEPTSFGDRHQLPLPSHRQRLLCGPGPIRDGWVGESDVDGACSQPEGGTSRCRPGHWCATAGVTSPALRVRNREESRQDEALARTSSLCHQKRSLRDPDLYSARKIGVWSHRFETSGVRLIALKSFLGPGGFKFYFRGDRIRTAHATGAQPGRNAESIRD